MTSPNPSPTQRQPKPGDWIIPDYDARDVTPGKPYQVIEYDGLYPLVVDDVGDRHSFSSYTFADGLTQPTPTPSDYPAVVESVRAVIEDRYNRGIDTYGTPLQPHNGRDALRDAQEEAADLLFYLTQAIMERDAQPAELSDAKMDLIDLANESPSDAIERMRSNGETFFDVLRGFMRACSLRQPGGPVVVSDEDVRRLVMACAIADDVIEQIETDPARSRDREDFK